MSSKLILLLSFIAYSSYSQMITVTGRVLASDGSAIPGANVLEKRTSNGTASDQEGRYSLTVAPDAVLVFSFVGYKSQEVQVEITTTTVDVTLSEWVLTHWPVVNIGYGHNTVDHIGTAVALLTDDKFNQGNIYDPAQSWQGKVAGLSIYNRGGNPHNESLLRIRGLTTLDPDSGPLIVIDGVPMSTLHNVDPQDIESISVLKDGASAAIYGMRGSQGVILVTTKGGQQSNGLEVTATAEGAMSTILDKQPVMTAAEHIAVGGNDLGSSTDWQDEITRTGSTSNYHVAVSGSSATSSFRVSTHIRSLNGVLLHSGFNQVNSRVTIRHAALNGRLHFDLNLAVTNRKTNFSFPLAFRYANTFLPSAPIYFPSGDFYQALLFDNYNPLAMLEQNLNLGRRRTTNYSAKVSFDIVDGLTLTANTGQQFENNFNGSYYSRNSFYIGQARGGLARRYTDDRSFTQAESYLSYYKHFGKILLDAVTGFSYQEDQAESFSVELGNFPNDALGYNAIAYSADVLAGRGDLIDLLSTTSPVNTIRAGFLRASMTLEDILTFSASVRQEKSNKLGVNQQSGLFPAASASFNLLHYLPNTSMSMLNARVGYGVTGSIPSQPGLASDLFDYTFTGGGTLYKVRDANPDLRWEKKKELNIGIDFSANRLTASINFYKRTITDIIQQRYVSTEAAFRYENAVGLKGNGLELAVDYYVGNGSGLTWQPTLALSTNKTTMASYPVDKEVRGFIDSPGPGSTQMIRIARGSRVGDIWGPVFNGVGPNGAAIFKDINGDGVVIANPGNALDPNTDFTSLGNGIPSWELGWGNKVGFRNWQLNAFFRGAFGHSLINLLRLSFEPLDAGAINSYNRVSTNKAVAGLMSSQHSSLYVEKAGFVKLDNVTLSYSFPTKGVSWLKSLQLYGTIQNAFVITDYSGVDPEPNLIDAIPTSTLVPPDPLVPGLDRNSSYYPARTFLLGLTVGI